MKRTSALQMQLMIEFMEKNGDLSKPTEGPQGRIVNINLWAQLTDLLNSDTSGESRTVERWRKVWSDTKNNVKRKAAKLHRAATGTGGGPALKIVVTDLDQRVLAITGTQAATGLIEVPEIGVDLDTSAAEEMIFDTQVSPSHQLAVLSPPPPLPAATGIQNPSIEIPLENWNRPGSSWQGTPFPLVHDQIMTEPLPERHGSTTPTRHANTQPASSPRRRRRPLLQQDLSSPSRKRPRHATQSELARQAFVNSDREWRAYLADRERERIRLLEMELEQQRRWQQLFEDFLTCISNAIEAFKTK